MTATGQVAHKADSEKRFQDVLLRGGEATTIVATDPQVFERITLGLYREPASAIRELISNAYDADASRVTVKTDVPNFGRIEVEDDGRGMSAAAIEYLLHHVGGSLKRTGAGADAGVTKRVGVSPGGRNLIGQMGIGLYSIARLTRRFTIYTKQQGDKHRYVLEVDLTGLNKDNPPVEGATSYIAGYAKLMRHGVSQWEIQDHGTKVVLHDILAEAKNLLQSRERWELRLSKASKEVKGELKYHIGFPPAGQPPNLPWEESPKAKTDLDRFKSLVRALSTRAEISDTSPSLDQTLDYYLGAIWRISLSAPLRYLYKHPFELTSKDGVDFYNLKGDATPERIEVPTGIKIGQHLDVHEEGASPTPFSVTIDNIELRRPVVFEPFADDSRRLLKRPKLFIGKFESEREGAHLSGTGYFYWSYDITPKENNGILVRVAGSSGELFNPRFLNYRTSENLRLRQVSAEAFVQRGFDNALNVDRESYVETDPAVRALQRWTHRSMTRIFTRLKKDQQAVAALKKEDVAGETIEAVVASAGSAWSRHRGKRSAPPEVLVSSKKTPPADLKAGTIFVGGIPSERRGGIEREVVFSARLRALVQILEAHDLLQNLSDEERSSLIAEIAAIFERD